MIKRSEIRKLIKELSSGEWSTRYLAMKTLEWNSTQRFDRILIPALLEKLDDRYEDVREFARTQLSSMASWGSRCKLVPRLVIPRLLQDVGTDDLDGYSLRCMLRNIRNRGLVQKEVYRLFREKDDQMKVTILDLLLPDTDGYEEPLDVEFILPELHTVLEKGSREIKTKVLEFMKRTADRSWGEEEKRLVEFFIEELGNSDEKVREDVFNFLARRNLLQEIDLNKLKKIMVRFVKEEESKGEKRGATARYQAAFVINAVMEVCRKKKRGMSDGILSEGTVRAPIGKTRLVRVQRVGVR